MLLPFAVSLADDAELESVRASVMDRFEGIKAENVQPSDVQGWYTIQKGPIVAYVSADGRYLLQGDLIDLDNQVNLVPNDAIWNNVITNVTGRATRRVDQADPPR